MTFSCYSTLTCGINSKPQFPEFVDSVSLPEKAKEEKKGITGLPSRAWCAQVAHHQAFSETEIIKV